jgi:hypothetical protein
MRTAPRQAEQPLTDHVAPDFRRSARDRLLEGVEVLGDPLASLVGFSRPAGPKHFERERDARASPARRNRAQ